MDEISIYDRALTPDEIVKEYEEGYPLTINVHLPSRTSITFASGDPVDIVNDGNGNIYVLDSTASTVYIYDIDGNLQRSFGSSGAGQGQFVYPKGIAVDNTGDIYVADTGNAQVLKYDSDGNFVFCILNFDS